MSKMFTLKADLDDDTHRKMKELVVLTGGDLTKTIRIAFQLALVVARHVRYNGGTVILRDRRGHEQEIELGELGDD